MKEYLVRLQRQHTVEDIKNGALGRRAVKDVLICCDRKDVEKKLAAQLENGWTIGSIKDWEKLCAESLQRTIQWIFDH